MKNANDHSEKKVKLSAEQIKKMIADNESLKNRIDKISENAVSAKTVKAKTDFWKKDKKSSFKSETSARNYFRKLQVKFSASVVKYSKIDKIDDMIEAAESLKNFYDEYSNHENYSLFSFKNTDTGKDYDIVRTAHEIMKITLSL
jgi:hypothetical protein